MAAVPPQPDLYGGLSSVWKQLQGIGHSFPPCIQLNPLTNGKEGIGRQALSERLEEAHLRHVQAISSSLTDRPQHALHLRRQLVMPCRQRTCRQRFPAFSAFLYMASKGSKCLT